MEKRLVEQSRNEALLREVNERVAEVNRAAEESTFAPDKTLFEFLCECGASGGDNGTCLEQVLMTVNEYEQVRSQDDRFVLSPGHESDWLEWVVARTERYVIVDKRREAEPFVADDPRRAGSS
jgi:hypothetical protein